MLETLNQAFGILRDGTAQQRLGSRWCLGRLLFIICRCPASSALHDAVGACGPPATRFFVA
ncbi:MAG: hypothetical protein AAFR56_08390, partial [Chloroflexota bacterium]